MRGESDSRVPATLPARYLLKGGSYEAIIHLSDLSASSAWCSGYSGCWGSQCAATSAPVPAGRQTGERTRPWTVKGKWGARGNWGRWGEEDKRGMLNVITPEMVVKATRISEAEAK